MAGVIDLSKLKKKGSLEKLQTEKVMLPSGKIMDVTRVERRFLEENVKDRNLWDLQLAWMRFEQKFPTQMPKISEAVEEPQRTQLVEASERHRKITDQIRAHAFIEGWNAAVNMGAKRNVANKYNGPRDTELDAT